MKMQNALCVHELFEAQAKRAPHNTALVCGRIRLSYGELEERSAGLASSLRALGVGPDTLVGICLDRSPDLVVAILGVLKAGGAYVPIDPSLPMERVSFIREDSGIRLVLTDKRLGAALPGSGVQPFFLDERHEIPGADARLQKPDPANLAYVRYTSGSTGKPKGVQIEHRSVVNFLRSMKDTPGIEPTDVMLSLTTLSFDISELEIHLPLSVGGRIVLLPRESAADGRAIIDAIEKEGVTVMQATPATWRLMIESGWRGSSGLKALCGGESLPPDLARELLPRCAELWNMYGPTETTVWSTCCRITDPADISIGRPIADTDVYVLDDALNPLPAGETGELVIGGAGLARGYLNRPELTAEKFKSHPGDPSKRLYRTGDLGRLLGDGRIECLGRLDFQIKIQGFRIEPGEIEHAVSSFAGVKQCVAIAREDIPGDRRLAAYFTARDGMDPDVSELRHYLEAKLPAYMVPALFVKLEQIPLTPNGKVDRTSLPKPSRRRPALSKGYIAPRTPIEEAMCLLWSELLSIDAAGIDDSFFELGGTSLLAVRMAAEWRRRTGRDLPLIKVFQYPSIAALSAYGEHGDEGGGVVEEQERRAARVRTSRGTQTPIAIIGMVGRFPGADDLETLWRNLCNRVESITVFPREELGIGIDESERYDPNYVPARGIIQGIELFDADFFGIGPLEASIMDPQQRLFLEMAYSALENAGYDPERCPGPVGVYAGIGDNHYYSINLLRHPGLLARAGRLAVEYGNEKDYIAMRVAYALNLTGPAISVNTACSTSLVTVDNAVRGLAEFECDLAIAGGIDIRIPQKSGFYYEEGGTFCKDGHCRPFDADATGTMFCDGAGIVVLKRLEDAVAAGDTIYAVIRGTAKNNNGSRTVSFLAPSVEGQAEVIARAQANAGVPVETIGYIEAHGTGTPVGDPIEIEALSRVFNEKTEKRGFCRIGSIKGNIGHPTNAAGVAGLIKAALVLHKEIIPPTLNYSKPNPKIDFDGGCFRPVPSSIPFPRGDTPRRTAVSSFGFGGTNAHAVLEEAPPGAEGETRRPMHLIPVSARTESALARYGAELAEAFTGMDARRFADAAYTLACGRRQLPFRRFIVSADAAQASERLGANDARKGTWGHCTRRNPPIAFLFGGQGTQYVKMGWNLYEAEPLFRAVVNECCDLLTPYLGRDLRELLFPKENEAEAARQSLQNTFFTQPAIFVIEYALAAWWKSIGVEPAIMAGHSIGEFVAAAVSGVFELKDVLRIVATRGRLMQGMPAGSMLSVRAGVEEIRPLLPASIQIAAVNSPSLCVISGPSAETAEFRVKLEQKGFICRELLTSHAFHSAMMDPILDPLRREFEGITLRAPSIPIISTVTGLPLTREQACDPGYWANQARMTVNFSSALGSIIGSGYDLCLECGPRATMSTLALQHALPDRPLSAIPSLGAAAEQNGEYSSLLEAVGSLWIRGVGIDWEAFHVHENRRRIPLPTYPFERKRYWVEPLKEPGEEVDIPAPGGEKRTDGTEPEKFPGGRDETTAGRIKDIIGQISGRNPGGISSTATFFELGLDSLSLVQMASILRREMGAKIGFGQLMEQYPTIKALAEHLEKTSAPMHETVPGEPSRASASRIGAEAPVTVPQRGIFLSSQLSPRLSSSYNESVTLGVRGTIDVDRMKSAIRGLYDRHDALRASFDENGKIMRFDTAREFPLAVEDLRNGGESEKGEKTKGLIEDESARVFPFPGGPFFRAMIILQAADRADVVLTGHHIICDGWSLDVLIRDFCALYSEALGGKPQDLPRAPSFGDYALSCAKREESADFHTGRLYYESLFREGFPALVLPSDNGRGSQRSFECRREEILIRGSDVQKVRSFATGAGCSFFSVILAAYAMMLCKISGQRRFAIALPTAEQPMREQPGLVGHCVNMIPFEVDAGGKKTVAECLAGINSQLSRSYDHIAYSLVHILDRLRPLSPRAGVRPVSVGITNVKKYRDSELPQSGFSVHYDINPRRFESFEFYLTVMESGDDLLLRCNYDTGLFKAETVADWMKTLCGLIRQVPTGGSAPIDSLIGAENPRAPDSAVIYALTEKSSASEAPETSAAGSGGITLDSLIGIWKSVLKTPRIDPDDNFFDIGGHSLMALSLASRIQRASGKKFPISSLLDAPTPRQCIAVINGGEAPAPRSSLVTIIPAGAEKPVFLFHSHGGNVLEYYRLATLLGKNRRIYAIQCRGVDGSRLIPEPVEAIAGAYIKEIREIQPHGPYLLGGYCFGGILAVESAVQLMREGEETELVFMINAATYDYTQRRLTNVPALQKYFWRASDRLNLEKSNIMGRPLGEQFRQFGSRLSRFFDLARVRGEKLWEKTVGRGKPGERKHSLVYHLEQLGDNNDGAWREYAPKRYDGHVLFFRAERQSREVNPDPMLGWKEYLGGRVDRHDIPGFRQNLLDEPAVLTIAELINRELRKCDGAETTKGRDDTK